MRQSIEIGHQKNSSKNTKQVCKNLALAGISVTVQDSTIVSGDDIGGAQFFVGKDDLGENRVKAATPRIQELNPFTKIQFITKSISDITDNELASFQVICMSGGSLVDQCRVSKICHEKSIPCYFTENCGFYGMVFADLNQHTYLTVKQGGHIDTSKPPTKMSHQSFNAFVNSNDWGKIHTGLRWGLSDQILGMLIWKHFVSSTQNKAVKINEFGTRLLQSKGFSSKDYEDIITKSVQKAETFLSCSNADLTPVCAVLGGFLAQDIVKVVSTHNEPINNIFTFDGTTGEGRVTKALLLS